MFNAKELGNIVPIHRHQSSDETMIMIQGSLIVNLYDANGNIIESHILKANSSVFGINIKTGISIMLRCLKQERFCWKSREDHMNHYKLKIF